MSSKIKEGKIAIIVQRAGKEIIGGAETHAMLVANILSKKYEVDILSSTAKSADTWGNFYDPGKEVVSDFLVIRRFDCDFTRSKKWHFLNELLLNKTPLDQFSSLKKEDRIRLVNHIEHLPLGFCKKWMELQGPYSSDLLNYLNIHQDIYSYFIFFTYLYPTTYFGVDQINDSTKIRIIPTYHDEPVAYLPIFKKYSNLKHLFSTDAEKNFVEKILYRKTNMSNEVIHYGIDDVYESYRYTLNSYSNYILYAGRLESGKGVDKLYRYFEKYYNKYKDLKLITIGGGSLSNYKHEAIDYRGFVSEHEKYRLMKGAMALVHPSAYESMSIVVLEAFMLETPCIVNKECQVLENHINISNGGFTFSNYQDFEKAILNLKMSPEMRNEMGKSGRDYFKTNYQMDSYESTLLNKIFVK